MFGQAVETLRANRERLDRLDHTLLERETLTEDEAYAVAGVAGTAPPAVARGEIPGARRLPGPPPDADALADDRQSFPSQS